MHCEICGCDIDAGQAVGCQKCSAPFHRDCWDFNGRCGIYGCGGTKTEEYLPSKTGAVVAIEEETTPPFRIEPYFESLLRKIPQWGRSSIFPALLGAFGATFVCVWVHLMMSKIKLPAILLLYGSGMGMALLASCFGGWLRRHSWLSFLFLVVSFTFVGGYTKSAAFGHTVMSYIVIGIYCILGALSSSALVEGIAGRLRRLGFIGLFFVFLRSAITAFFFYCLMYGHHLIDACPFSLREIWVLPFLSFFVATIPLEVGKSSLMNRLKAEAKRLRLTR